MIRQTARDIETEATRWVMRLDREGRTAEVCAELDAWLDGDTRRRGALLQAEAAWALLDRLGELDETVTPEQAGVQPDKESVIPAKAGIQEHEDDESSAPIFTRRRLLIGTGAAIAASFAGGLFLITRQEVYSTQVGEIRRVPLADGSTAAINTKSEIAVAFAPQRRVVRLKDGEAWFQVERDPARPFIVEAGRVRVMAVGTAFAVRRRERGADVLVTEGVVEAWAEGAEGHRIRLAAGERAFVADDSAITAAPAAPSEVDRALAWRSGRIDLAGETLSHAVDEFNRYNQRRIVVADPRIGEERFYGVFRTDDPEGFAMAVRSSLGVPVQVGPSEIEIGRHTP